MAKNKPIEVTSHVARDFLQNAAYFNTLPKLVWEYVANSLDAAREGEAAAVVVEITSRYVTISDNGVGMSREELRSFFQMHGENIQRKLGKRVRGRFGTGKCAAFGLANHLAIDTTHAGLRNVVELRRSDIERAPDGAPFPVRDKVVDEPTDGQDGTTVVIRNFNVKRPNVDKVKAYLERHLSRYRKRAHVIVNGHVCQFAEPSSVAQYERLPPAQVARHIGRVPLLIKVSPVPLDDETNGIDILSHGIWHETTLANIERKERANHIFGHIDVPILEDGEWPIPAFDNTRNNILNRQNPVVVVLLGWLSEELEAIRQALVEKERQRRSTEIARQLAREARRISRILNEDFAQQEMDIELARRVVQRSRGEGVQGILGGQGQPLPEDGSEPQILDGQGQLVPEDGSEPQSLDDQGQSWSVDESELAMLVDRGRLWIGDESGLASQEGIGGQQVTDVFAQVVESDTPGSELTVSRSDEPVAGDPTNRPEDEPPAEEPPAEEPPPKKRPRRRRAVFSIEYEHATEQGRRARYQEDTKTIHINLDHPQIASAFEAGGEQVDAQQFRETCYEVAAVEYAVALPHEKIEQDELYRAEDALWEVRDNIDRVSKRFVRILYG